MGEYRSRSSSKSSTKDGFAGFIKAGLLWKIGTRGQEEGQIHTATDCGYLSKGILAVTELDNQRIQLFDNDGKSLGTLADGKVRPRGITIDNVENNLITVCDKDKTIKIFNIDGEIVDCWDKGIFGRPHGVAITASDKYVVTDLDPSKPKISIHDLDGSVIRQFGSRKEGDVYVENPAYVAVDQHQRIIVPDSTNHCIKIFDMEGKLLLKFGSQGESQSQFKFPSGCFVDDNDNIFIADNGNHRISLFSSTGKFIQNILTEHDSITWPEGLAVSEDGLLAITEFGVENDFIKVFGM